MSGRIRQWLERRRRVRKQEIVKLKRLISRDILEMMDLLLKEKEQPGLMLQEEIGLIRMRIEFRKEMLKALRNFDGPF
uniref:NS4 n=1 Tax=Japanaut virus TaxID=2547358 RepID=A0A482A5A0_9REOV|nr:NS4 [Japanaut virus]